MPKKDSVSNGTAPARQAHPIAAAAGPDHEDIARLASSYWEARAGDDGSPEDDWFRAENDLRIHRASVGN